MPPSKVTCTTHVHDGEHTTSSERTSNMRSTPHVMHTARSSITAWCVYVWGRGWWDKEGRLTTDALKHEFQVWEMSCPWVLALLCMNHCSLGPHLLWNVLLGAWVWLLGTLYITRYIPQQYRPMRTTVHTTASY